MDKVMKTEEAKTIKSTGNDMKDPDERFENIIAVTIVMLLLVGSGWWMYTRYTDIKNPQSVDTARYDAPIGSSPVLGSDNATMTVVLFSDFECSYCGQFENEYFPLIKQEYIDTGKVLFVFKQFPLSSHKEARLAAQAALCADDQGKFWEYHDVLFSNQDALTPNDLVTYAKQVGLDEKQFADCANGDSSRLDTDIALAKELGVIGTPTFFFNGRKVVGALTYADFSSQMTNG